jgi:hypothetical protein
MYSIFGGNTGNGPPPFSRIFPFVVGQSQMIPSVICITKFKKQNIKKEGSCFHYSLENYRQQQ